MLLGSKLGAVDLSALSTQDELHLYVDNIRGSDANSGSASNPLKTLIEAEDRIPFFVNHAVVVHVLPYDASVPNVGLYDWPTFRARILNERILVVGEGFQTVATGTAQAGTTQSQIATTGGLTIDEYVDEPSFIRITSGLAQGDIRTISENGTDFIDPAQAFTELVSEGDTYEILRPLVRCAISDTEGAFILAEGTNPAGGPVTGTQTSGLFLINMYIEPVELPTSSPPMLETRNIAVNVFGLIVLYPYNLFIKTESAFCAGQEQVLYTFPNTKIPTLYSLLPSLSPNPSSCMAWGISFKKSIYLHTALQGFDGYVVTPKTLAVRMTHPVQFNKHIVSACLRGGRCGGLSVGTPYRARSGYCSIRPHEEYGHPHVDFKVRSTGSLLVNVVNGFLHVWGLDCGTTGTGDGVQVTGKSAEMHVHVITGLVAGVGMYTAQGGKIEANVHSVELDGTLGGFSEDNKVTIRDLSLLVEGAYYSDWRVDPGTHAVSGTGAIITCP